MADPLPPRMHQEIDRDVACISCGYNLRGLQRDGDCPECGAPIARSLRRGPEPVVDEWRIQTGLAIRLEIWVAALAAGCCAFGGLLGLLNHDGLSMAHPNKTEPQSHIIMRRAIATMRAWLLLLMAAMIYLLYTTTGSLQVVLLVVVTIASAIRFGVVYSYIAELADRYDAWREAWLMRAAALAQVVTQSLAAVVFASPAGLWGWLIILPIAGTLGLSVYALNRVAFIIEPPEPDTSEGAKTPPLRIE